MFRRFLPVLLVVAAMLADTSVLPVVAGGWATPLVLLPTVIVLGLLLGRTRGLLFGMIAGILIDVLVSYPLGLMAISYMVAGYLSGVAGRKFQRYMLTPVVTPLLLLSAFELMMAGYRYIAGMELTLYSLRGALVRVAIETLVAQCLYLLYNRLLRPSWSKYAAR